MARQTFENEIAEISGGKFVTENIVDTFKPLYLSDESLTGANNKVKFLNFVLGEAEENSVVEFLFNSKLNQNEDYLNSTYSLVYGFHIEEINKENLTVEHGDYDLSLTHMLDNAKHYCIMISKTGKESVAYKLFGSKETGEAIVQYDIVKHMENYEQSKMAKRNAKRDKILEEELMAKFGLTLEEVRVMSEAK